jgi:hypothetical protein
MSSLIIHTSDEEKLLTIRDGMIVINRNGTMQFGEKYSPKAAALEFWKAIENLSPVYVQVKENKQWRDLALQFDNHRMQAMSHLKLLLEETQLHKEEATLFVSAPPLAGEEVLKQRLKEMFEKTVNENKEIKRRVVSAAIRAEDGTVLMGIRHYSQDMYDQMAVRKDGEQFRHRDGDDQGFVDQMGIYMTRFEAYDVALKAGQIKNLQACSSGPNGQELHSEGIY